MKNTELSNVADADRIICPAVTVNFQPLSDAPMTVFTWPLTSFILASSATG